MAENQNIEWKESWRDEYLKWICGFANAQGGKIYIANTFFRAGFIEAWGRGIQKIKDSCEEAGNPMPEYMIKREEIMVMFRSLVSLTNQAANQAVYQAANQAAQATAQATNQAGTQEEKKSIDIKILRVLSENPNLSQKKVALMIDEKYSAVKYHIESMKKAGILVRTGSSQKGKWIIVDRNSLH